MSILVKSLEKKGLKKQDGNICESLGRIQGKVAGCLEAFASVCLWNILVSGWKGMFACLGEIREDI